MWDARLKGRAPRAHVNCWEDRLFHSHQRSKIVLNYQPLKPNTYPPVVVVHKYFGWRPLWVILESSSRKCHWYVTMRVQSSWPTIRFNMQEQKHIDVRHHFIRDHQQKGGHLHWECRHWRTTCRYIHQAIGWEKVLQAKEWVEHIGFLKYVLMHPHLYDMPLLRAIQGKSWLAWHTSLLRTCLVHLVISPFY